MVLADSPLACIRCARAGFDLSSTLGRPICCPRARRGARAAAGVRREAKSEAAARIVSGDVRRGRGRVASPWRDQRPGTARGYSILFGGALGQITAELALDEPEREINPARNAAAGYQITVVDHSVLHQRRPRRL